MNTQLLDDLLAPIPGGHPGGEDMSFSREFDAIREARRQDDAGLSQGEWQTAPKAAQWPLVARLCEDLLKNRSKDLQAACWYTDALIRTQGFSGLVFGLTVLQALLSDFWEFLYPPLDPSDPEERAARLVWLDREAAAAVREAPLTGKETGFSWLTWQAAMTLDNLALKDPAARQAAARDGAISGEQFDRAAMESGLNFYQSMNSTLTQAARLVAQIEDRLDTAFGQHAPTLPMLRQALSDCRSVVSRSIAKLGGVQEVDEATSPVDTVVPAKIFTPIATNASLQVPPETAVVTGAANQGVMLTSRREAVVHLRLVASYFREQEPHSPVGPLVERAAKWAEMPLDQWLEAVVKDAATLQQLRELLDLPRDRQA
ncbi:type VI secretion system protein ImpA [Noviherbaspirillum humi]|uniref:Type VI secretion system protein ImpA n=1 Tax=Noviherbaspirillum humi TaxID=1688639 RepID=A0A239DL55_9BURK|nr:type VI secretion system protein TssA [Noviherbaspirillum humi]SNS32374.1 type VI secretion system protein ImpA [Noviherbaspirillum humi]